MSKILIVKANVDLAMAAKALEEDDEFFVQAAAYHTQQAIEKILKFVLENYGISYKRIHHVDTLASMLPSGQNIISEEQLDIIYDNAILLKGWESEVRYDTEYMAQRRTVVRMLEFAKTLYSVASAATDKSTCCVSDSDKPTLRRMKLD